jgi:hypothetical protein
MGDGRKILPLAVALLAGAAAFGAGVMWLGGGDQPTPHERVAAAAPTARLAVEETPTTDPAASPEQATTFVLPTRTPASFGPGPVSVPAARQGPWAKRSGYGLPDPRPLTAAEKQALNLLGDGVKTAGYKFSRVTLDDGSTVPGVPPLRPEEVESLVLGKVRSQGIGDGFEDAVRTLAVQNPNYLMLKVSREAAWAELEQILGPQQTAHGPRTVYYAPPGQRGQVVYQMTWYGSGWLSFGVDSGRVRMIQASFPMFGPGLVPAESVPGGRSLPDPSKARKSGPRPRF